jgi:hypothetical protein
MIPTPRLACEQCKRRKIRCNKGSPCSACKNADLQCQTVQRARLPRGKSSKNRAHNSQLEDRVARIEALLIQQSQATNEPSPVLNNDQAVSTATSTFSQDQLTDAAPVCLSTVTRPMASFVAPEFWTALSEEIQGLRETIEYSEDELEDLTYRDGAANDTSNTCAILFPQTTTGTVGIVPNPPSDTHLELLEHFKSRVDSVYKILHWPIVSSMISQRHSGPVGAYSVADVQILKSSIYFMAVCSMTNEEVKTMGLGERIEALQAYRSTVEALFTKSCLLMNPTLVALQAFVIYLVSYKTSGRSTSMTTPVTNQTLDWPPDLLERRLYLDTCSSRCQSSYSTPPWRRDYEDSHCFRYRSAETSALRYWHSRYTFRSRSRN